MKTEVELHEWESKRLSLEKQDIVFLNAQGFEGKLGLRPLGDNLYELSAKSSVGVVVLPSGLVIRILPKISLPNFFTVVSYTFGFGVDFSNLGESVEFGEGPDFAEFLARLFLVEVSGVIRLGLYRSYSNQRDNLHYVKGRIMVEESLRKNIWRQDLVFCEYDELSADNLENRCILYAGHLLSNLPLSRETASMVYDTVNMLFSKGVRLERLEEIDVLKAMRGLNRLNYYYNKVLELARLIISCSYIASLSPGKAKGFAFLLDMNRVFENLVTKLIIDSHRGYQVKYQEKYFDRVIKKVQGLRAIMLKPDIEIHRNNRLLVLVDAKYKNFDGSVEAGDLYQATTYSLALDTDVILVFPSNTHPSGRVGHYELKKGKSIIVGTIRLDSPLEGKQYLDDLFKQIRMITELDT